RQTFEQGRGDLRPLSYEYESVAVGEAPGELVEVLDVVVEDRHVMAGELVEAREGAEGVEPVVEDDDVHVSSFFVHTSGRASGKSTRRSPAGADAKVDASDDKVRSARCQSRRAGRW